MKILRVGDPHVRPSNLEESERLMTYVWQLALEKQVDKIELLGDLFHTHAILRLEVIAFWNKWLRRLAAFKKTIAMVGNHDLSGDFNSKLNSLTVFEDMEIDNLTIVSNSVLSGVFGYLPYIHTKEQFLRDAEELRTLGAKVLVCHATIDGSKYENGFYAPDGMPLPPGFIHIISGHIHALQEFANVIYPGTARWDTASDANQPKGLWIFEHDDDGTINKRDFYTTEHVCAPIYSYVWNEGNDAPVIPPGCRATVEAVGSSDFCQKAKALFKGKASFKAKPQDQAKRENRKSGRSLKEFLVDHYPIKPERRLKLLKFMEDEKLV